MVGTTFPGKDKEHYEVGVFKWIFNSGSSRRRGRNCSTTIKQETLIAEDMPGHSSNPCLIVWPTQQPCEAHLLTALLYTGKAEVQRQHLAQPAGVRRAPGGWGEPAQGQRRFLTPLRSQGCLQHHRQVRPEARGPTGTLEPRWVPSCG